MATRRKATVRTSRAVRPAVPLVAHPPKEIAYRGMRFLIEPCGMDVAAALVAMDAAMGVGAKVDCVILVVNSDPREKP